jgi:guanylate kinase
MSRRGNLFIVSAPSGGGKTSLTRALLPGLAERGIPAQISVSYTTRAPRPGEQDGVHYHFVSPPAFEQMIERGEFLEHAEVYGRRYGTGRARTMEMLDAGTDVILDIDWQGARQVRERVSGAIGIFILPPSRIELERRLRSRAQDSDATILARMAEAHAEMEHHGEYDYLVVNQDFEHALADLAAIFSSAREGRESPQSQALAREAQARRHSALIAQLLAATA